MRGSNLAFPDFISRNIMIEEHQKHQLHQKPIPRDIELFDKDRSHTQFSMKITLSIPATTSTQ